jgi:hypothetical protein
MLEVGAPPLDWCLPMHIQLHVATGRLQLPSNDTVLDVNQNSLQALASAALASAPYWCAFACLSARDSRQL